MRPLLFLSAMLIACAGAGPRVSTIAPRVVSHAEYGRCVELGGKIEIDGVGVISQIASTCFLAMDAAVSDAAVVDSQSDPPVYDKIPDAGGTE